MNTFNDISEELSSMDSPLAGMSRITPYHPPGTDYFDQLPQEIIAAIHTEGFAANKSKHMPFALPEGYFDQLQAAVMEQVQHQPAAAEPNWPKAQPLSVPAGYFDTLAGDVLAKIQAEQPFKKTGRIIDWKPLRWAAAAIVVLGIGIGSVRIMQQGGKPQEVSIAQLPASSVKAYVQQNIDDFDAELIENNIASVNTGAHAQAALPPSIDQSDIIQYLDENGWDEATITN